LNLRIVTAVVNLTQNPVPQLNFFSVQPLCSLCLCGCLAKRTLNQRETENTKVAQRNPKPGHYSEETNA